MFKKIAAFALIAFCVCQSADAVDGILRQSTAVTVKLGPFVDSTDGNTDEGSLTVTNTEVRVSKNGGDFGDKNEASSLVYDETGYYNCALNTTDTNTVGVLTVVVHESGALHVRSTFQVVEEAVYDTLYASAATGECATTGNNFTAIKGAGFATGTDSNKAISDRQQAGVDVNITSIAGDTDAATAMLATYLGVTVSAVNDASATTTSFDTDLTEASDDHYNAMYLCFTSGNLKGQARKISDYNGTTKVISVSSAFTEAPADDDEFVIIGRSE